MRIDMSAYHAPKAGRGDVTVTVAHVDPETFELGATAHYPLTIEEAKRAVARLSAAIVKAEAVAAVPA